EVYIACDSISAWIGTCYNYEDLIKTVAGPEVLRESIIESLSCDELEVIEAALDFSDNKYMIGNKWFTMLDEEINYSLSESISDELEIDCLVIEEEDDDDFELEA
ncbi:MAG: hypothetical protein ACRDB0_03705, partial [Paraclostridium sp.]